MDFIPEVIEQWTQSGSMILRDMIRARFLDIELERRGEASPKSRYGLNYVP